MILTNVVVAVLLEKMVSEDDHGGDQHHQAHEAGLPAPPSPGARYSRREARAGVGGAGDGPDEPAALHGLAELHTRIDGVEGTLGRLDSGMRSLQEQMVRVDRALAAIAAGQGTKIPNQPHRV